MGEIEAIELFSGLGHSTVMVAGCGQGCPRLTFRGLGILIAVAAVVSASGAAGVRVWPDYVGRPKTTRGTTAPERANVDYALRAREALPMVCEYRQSLCNNALQSKPFESALPSFAAPRKPRELYARVWDQVRTLKPAGRDSESQRF